MQISLGTGDVALASAVSIGANLVPAVLFVIIYAFFFLAYGGALIKRKGLSNVWLIGFLIPSLNIFFLLWAASKPDKVLLDRIEELENRLNMS